MTVLANKQMSMYLHIPFCKSMCSYCAFNTYTEMDALIPRFVAALAQEIRILAAVNPGYTLKTVFFGGGTPSLLTPQQYEQLFDTLFREFCIADGAEISLESNPNDLDADYLQALRALGFNRLSIGMQSAQPKLLQLYERRHDMRMVEDAVQAARESGFENISLDLIYGAPHQTLQDWEQTLQAARALEVEHLSAYNLELKGGTPLRSQVEAGEVPAPDDDLSADMYERMSECLSTWGYEQYEISNWARPGYQAQHNLQYWHNQPYVGLGPGAHGFADGVRYIIVRHPERYIHLLEASAQQPRDFPYTPAFAKATRVSRETDMAETIMMGLRLTTEGVARQAFRERFGVDIVEAHPAAIQKHVSLGLLHVDEERVRLTERGRFLSNAVIRDFV